MFRKSGFAFGLAVAGCAAACGQGDVDSNSARPDNQPESTASATVAAKSPDALPEGYVHVPNGVTAHIDCIHELPSGAHVDGDDNVTIGDKLVAHYAKCSHPIQISRRVSDTEIKDEKGAANPGPNQSPYSNWVEAAWTNAPANEEFISSSDTFLVPKAPNTPKDTSLSKNGQIIYLFPSIQGGGAIVQPVLQWGNYGGEAAGTGFNGSGSSIGNASGWTYAAWGVTASNIYHSAPISVNTGDTLQGTMAAWSQSSSGMSWEIVAGDETTGASTWEIVDFTTTALWNNAQAAVLEVYNVNSCNDFPATDLTFQYPTLSYSTFGSPWSGHQTTVNPSSTIWTALYYSNGGLLSSYSGPSCNFDTAFGSVSQGTTLTY